jgi:hypothetical protein
MARDFTVRAVVFPPDFPQADRVATLAACANPDAPTSAVVLAKCYIFTPPEHDCITISDWQGNSPAILVH